MLTITWDDRQEAQRVARDVVLQYQKDWRFSIESTHSKENGTELGADDRLLYHTIMPSQNHSVVVNLVKVDGKMIATAVSVSQEGQKAHHAVLHARDSSAFLLGPETAAPEKEWEIQYYG